MLPVSSVGEHVPCSRKSVIDLTRTLCFKEVKSGQDRLVICSTEQWSHMEQGIRLGIHPVCSVLHSAHWIARDLTILKSNKKA